MSQKHKPEQHATPEPAKPKKGLVGLIGVVLFIGGVIGAETLAAYLLLPSASEVTAAAAAQVERAAAKGKAEEKEDAEEEEAPTIEVDLGNYSISSHQPAGNTTLRIDFKLVGTVHTADKAEFEELLNNNKNRLRDRVIFEVRSAEINDLTDPGLGLIKRRILERVNALLGKPLLQGVIVSDFSFVGA